MTSESLSLQFFDVRAVIRSDSPAFLDFFKQTYQRFIVSDELPANAEYALYTQADNPWGRALLALDGQTWDLDDSGVLKAYAYDGVLGSILAKVRSHYLIHAAALSWGNSGVALIADAGQGKTTLSLELIGRGFSFLSDELAAIIRQSNRLEAFARRMRLRPQTLDLLNIWEKAAGAPFLFGKYLVDIEDIFPGSLIQEADLDYLILLESENSEIPGTETGSGGEMDVYVDRFNDELLSALNAIPGVERLEPEIIHGFPIIHINARQKGQAMMMIEEICASWHVFILEINRRPLRAPSFYPQAGIEPVPHSQAMRGLLRQFFPGHHSMLIREDYDGSPTRLFMELAQSLKQTECYRLRMGPLRQTADLICELVCH